MKLYNYQFTALFKRMQWKRESISNIWLSSDYLYLASGTTRDRGGIAIMSFRAEDRECVVFLPRAPARYVFQKLQFSLHETYIMAPKRANVREPLPSTPATTQISTPVAIPAPAVKATTKSSSSNLSPQEIALSVWQNYLNTTPQRTKLIDIFMAFLVTVGALQFVYCVIAGNFVCAIQMLRSVQHTDILPSPSMPSSRVSLQLWDSLF